MFERLSQFNYLTLLWAAYKNHSFDHIGPMFGLKVREFCGRTSLRDPGRPSWQSAAANWPNPKVVIIPVLASGVQLNCEKKLIMLVDFKFD